VAANTTPIFVITPHIGLVRISTANTNRDGTGTLGDVFTGTTNGSRIDRITMTATATTTAGMLRFFIFDGTNTRAWQEVQVTAITPSGTVKAFTYTIVSDSPTIPLLVLPSTWVLRVGTVAAETFDVTAFGGDY
jgi:hypothetical protein